MTSTPHEDLIPFPAELLEALVDHARPRTPDAIPVVAAGVAHGTMLLARHHRRATIQRFRTGGKVSIDEALEALSREEADHAPRPRWDYVSKATEVIARMLRDDPGSVANADALGAYVRERFDALGLAIANPETLYVAITTAALMVELADNGERNGQTDRATVHAIASIAQSFTAALLPYLPEGVRRG